MQQFYAMPLSHIMRLMDVGPIHKRTTTYTCYHNFWKKLRCSESNVVPQIFWQNFSAFRCTNKWFLCFPKGCVCFCAFQISGSLSGSFMYYSSSTFCMLFRCWWQHYGCRWESATLFSLIFGCICYFGRLVLLSSHSLSLSISSVSWDIYLRTNSNQTWFIIELKQIKFFQRKSEIWV